MIVPANIVPTNKAERHRILRRLLRRPTQDHPRRRAADQQARKLARMTGPRACLSKTPAQRIKRQTSVISTTNREKCCPRTCASTAGGNKNPRSPSTVRRWAVSPRPVSLRISALRGAPTTAPFKSDKLLALRFREQNTILYKKRPTWYPEKPSCLEAKQIDAVYDEFAKCSDVWTEFSPASKQDFPFYIGQVERYGDAR